MGPVYLAARSLSGETRYSLSRPSDFKRANADVCLATSPLRITDGRMWGRELPGGHRREREDALANPDEQFVGPMPSCKANDEPSVHSGAYARRMSTGTVRAASGCFKRRIAGGY